MYVFEKDEYDFVAIDKESKQEYKIYNISQSKFVKKLFNWIVADSGFTYETSWDGIKYIISPTFAGRGYKLRTTQGEYLGQVLESNFSSNIKIKTRNSVVILEYIDGINYNVTNNGLKIGKVETSGILKRYPISISIQSTSEKTAYLLVFFAVLKGGL